MNAQVSNQMKTKLSSEVGKILSIADFENFERREVNDQTFSVWVRQLLQNWRQGTVASKGRSDVSFSRKKPWKQKGTGRARAGTARSPLWRGGGTIFGPQARVRTLKVSKKMRIGVLNALFWQMVEANNVICLDWQVQGDAPKTSAAYQLLKNAQLENRKVNLLLPIDDVLHSLAFSNIPNVQILAFDELNAYDLSLANVWIVLKKDLDAFKQVVNLWN